MKRLGRPKAIVIDRLQTYRADLREIDNKDHQQTGRWLNIRLENSHQHFRRRQRAMPTFRSPATLQKIASIQASVRNRFNQERHFYRRNVFKDNRSTALSGSLSLRSV